VTKVTKISIKINKKENKKRKKVYSAEFLQKNRHNRHIPDNQAVTKAKPSHYLLTY